MKFLPVYVAICASVGRPNLNPCDTERNVTQRHGPGHRTPPLTWVTQFHASAYTALSNWDNRTSGSILASQKGNNSIGRPCVPDWRHLLLCPQICSHTLCLIGPGLWYLLGGWLDSWMAGLLGRWVSGGANGTHLCIMWRVVIDCLTASGWMAWQEGAVTLGNRIKN